MHESKKKKNILNISYICLYLHLLPVCEFVYMNSIQ